MSWLLFARDVELGPGDRAFVADVCTRCPPLAQARGLAHEFRRILREHGAGAFLAWLAAAHPSAIERVVRGPRYDIKAVSAGVALP